MKDKDHGIVFCKEPIKNTNCYIEFKINMSSKSRGKSHLFIGIVDKSKYKLENLISTFWKDSPSSYYWDVWGNKLVKTDEKGCQTASISGYGCQCEESSTTIGMIYSHADRSISFVKDGINQGVAFKNIMQGMYPSIDIWFELGSVEIISDAIYKNKKYL